MPEKPPNNHAPIFDKTEFVENQEPKGMKDRLMDIYYDSIPLFNLNVAWFLLCLPIITFLPATGGLYQAVLNYNRKEPAKWQTLWKGVKKNWAYSLKWGGVVLLGSLILAVNIWFSLNIEASWSLFTLFFGLIIAIIWVTINQFSLPLLLLQEEKKVFLAIRNAYVIFVRRPWDAIKVTLLSLLITIVSVLIPPLWFFISMALIAHLQTRTVLLAIEKTRAQDAERDAANAQPDGNGSE
jgi:uncharacterized membrane protein YesL